MKQVIIQIGNRRFEAVETSDVIPCHFCKLPQCISVKACNKLIGYQSYFAEVESGHNVASEALPVIRSRVDDDSEYINE